jgi:hypothetical protein
MKKRLLMSILPVIALVGLSSAAAAPKPADGHHNRVLGRWNA